MSTLGAQLSIKGERRTGQDVRTQNVMAASSIANIVKVRIIFDTTSMYLIVNYHFVTNL